MNNASDDYNELERQEYALLKKDGESDFQYHKRLVYGKLVDGSLSDCDYSELSKYVYGKPYSGDVARRLMYGSRKTLELLDKERFDKIDKTGSEEILSEIDQRMIELRKEKQKFYDQRAAFTKLVRDRSREEEVNDILVNAIQNSNLPTLEYKRMYIAPSTNDLLVSLNDIHYGLCVDNSWNEYNPSIFTRMLQNYLDRILLIAKTHKCENCIVYNNGDSISGNIHLTIQVANNENVVQQIMGVSELISEFLSKLSPYFKKVQYVSVAGNHSRLNTKDNSPIDERLDDLIEWYLSARLHNFDNINIGTQYKVDPTAYIMNIRGKIYCGVHGDYDGDMKKIKSLNTMAEYITGEPLYAILLGHLHHNKVEEVDGIKTIMAGSFVGMDDYCIKNRIFGRPQQLVCVCNDEGVVCYYDVNL